MKNKKTLEQLVNEPYCEPKQDPKLGDLTPSYIDWFYKLSSGGCTGTGWNCIDDISSGNFGNANINIPLTAGLTYYIMGDPESTIGGNVTFILNCPTIGPCISTISYSVLNMPTIPTIISSTCLSGNGQFTDEYSTWNTGVAGTIYNVQSSLSTDWVTVRVGSPSGTVVGYGITPIIFTAPSNNTYYVHIKTNGYCVDDGNCRDITVTRISSLPIELTQFTGYKTNEYNVLSWQTGSEHNNSHFILERSINSEFSTIAKIEGAGNSSSKLDYSFIDYLAPQTINYYRLTQVDFDGNSRTYDPISIDNRGDKTVVKYLNVLGQEVSSSTSGLIFEVYDNGSLKKIWR